MNKPRLLDLFSGAGGAARGLTEQHTENPITPEEFLTGLFGD